MRLRPRIRQFLYVFAVRVERLVLGPIVEAEPVDVVDEGLRRRILREDE